MGPSLSREGRGEVGDLIRLSFFILSSPAKCSICPAMPARPGGVVQHSGKFEMAWELFQQGLRHHQQGRLQQAEAIYRQVLAEDPTHADNLHLLGVLAHQTGRSERAVAYIGQAIKLQPIAARY